MGLSYDATYKLTDDRFSASGGLEEPTRGKNHVYGLGPEFTLEGSAWNVLATFLLKPMKTQP